MSELELTATPPRVVRKRLNKAPEPRFKPDISDQFDAILGCPALALPENHLARALKRELALLDFSKLETKYSSQGQHGYHPRHLVGALVYASLLRIHESTKIERALTTDLALRFVAGGHAISAGRLRAFRRENFELFEELLQQLVKLAYQRELIVPEEISVDSVRLRAHAATSAVRTLKRSKQRLKQLAEVDVATLTPEEREAHEAKVEKHTEAVRLCTEQKVPSVVLTSPSAGLQKLPSGATVPGHRATVVASGVKTRFVIDVFVDGTGNDFGKLGKAVLRGRQTLESAGVPLTDWLVTADSGYFSLADLIFASENRPTIDVLIDDRTNKRSRNVDGEPLFQIDDFDYTKERVICPAGAQMNGPLRDGKHVRFEGVGCAGCGLKNRCTRGNMRTLTVDPRLEEARQQMRERLAAPGARERYNKRIATVEPVFSMLESEMGYRRVTSRAEKSVRAEVLLKVLAYNLSRLLAAKKLRRVRMVVDEELLSTLPEAA